MLGWMVGRALTAAPGAELLERNAELACIAELIDGALDGSGSILVVEGPPGIGKTRLLQSAQELATEREVRALTARGAELEHTLSFGVAAQLFEPSLRQRAPDARDHLMSGPARLAA